MTKLRRETLLKAKSATVGQKQKLDLDYVTEYTLGNTVNQYLIKGFSNFLSCHKK